jgi:hypothetical protein
MEKKSDSKVGMQLSLFSFAHVDSDITHIYFDYMLNGCDSMFRLLKYLIKKLCNPFHPSSSAPAAAMVLKKNCGEIIKNKESN